MVALDYGRRRIGVAASDPTRTIASPRAVVETTGASPPPGEPAAVPEALVSLLRELAPAKVVVGIPLRMDGGEGAMAREARAFGRAVAERTGLEVIEWDERLTTQLAERALASLELPRRKRREKGRADMLAAAALLRSFLASEEARR